MEADGGESSHSMLQFPVNLYCTTTANVSDDQKPINEMDFFAEKNDVVEDLADQSKFTDENSDHIHHDINEMESELPAELIHRIQSLLSEEDAGRTCILSKSWLHAWYTIPNLKFHNNKRIGDTLKRYHRQNLPIETLDIRFNIKKKDTAPIRRWIRQVASKSCLKELFLSFNLFIDLFTLPDEIFSGENLTRINVINHVAHSDTNLTKSLWICSSNNNNMIKCVSLRVLKLQKVYISEELFNSLLSTCILLKKIELCLCKGLKTVKVKNLPCLTELGIELNKEDCVLEIDNVPSLVFFHFWKHMGAWAWEKPLPFKLQDQIVSVTQLHIHGLFITDDAFVNMIKSKFLFLEDLNVGVVYWGWNMKSLVITSGTLKRLTLQSTLINSPSDVQVDAPKLLSFSYEGRKIPTLSFPVDAPNHIMLNLHLTRPVDLSFFLKMREVLNLSSTFDIYIIGYHDDTLVALDTDVDDLRTRVPFPATNVQQLYIKTYEHVWKHKLYYDSFFSICHPSHLKAALGKLEDDNNNRLFSMLMVREIMEKKKTTDLKKVQLQNPRSGRWEDLTLTSWKTFIDTHWPYSVEFKLDWFTQ